MTISEAKKKFTFDVGWVFASTVMIFLLHFLQNPIMARYLGPDGFGLYSMVLIVASIISLIAGLGIDGAIGKYVAEHKDDVTRVHALFSSGLITTIVLGVISSVVLFILSDTLASIFNMPLLSHLLKLYALIFPFSLAYGVILGLLNGLREMKYYSLINALQGFLTFSFIVALLVVGFGVEGAVIGNMLAIIASTGIAILIMKNFTFFTLYKFKESSKKLTVFGSQLMLGNAINIINYQADILLIAYFLTATDVGYYAVAVSLSRFFWRVPDSIQRVSFPTSTEYWAKGKFDSLNKMIDKSMKYSACLLLIVGLGVWFFAEGIIVFLFGPAFFSAILPLRILLIGTVLFSIFKTIGGTLPAIGRPDLGFMTNAIGAIANVVLNVLLIPRFGIAGAAIATITSLIIIEILSVYFIIKLTKVAIDVKWYVSLFTITLLAMAAFSACSDWIGIYIFGSIILSIYAILIFMFFLTKEDKETFVGLIRSIVFREDK